MHFSTHVRQSMLDWLDARLPEQATVEHNYVRTQVPAEDMLRQFLVPESCSDTFPKEHAALVARLLDYEGSTARMSYAVAASALLTAMSSGPDAGAMYLESALVEADERRLFGPPPFDVWVRLDDADRRALMAASQGSMELPSDIARKLHGLGVRVNYVSMGHGPFYPQWPHRLLRYAAAKRREAERAAL